jgi:hypothetical protein
VTKKVKEGNIVICPDTLKAEYRGNLSKAIMEGTVTKVYGKVKGSNRACLSAKIEGGGIFSRPKFSKFPDFAKQTPEVQRRLMEELVKALQTSVHVEEFLK